MVDFLNLRLLVAGAGTMGSGIAQLGIVSGMKVMLYDLNPEVLDKAVVQITKNLQKLSEKKIIQTPIETILDRLVCTSNVDELMGDIFIEAVVERLEVKQRLFQTVLNQNHESIILASNTSSIPITRIAAGLSKPERLAGMHFFNPAPVMKLVEIIAGIQSSSSVVHTLTHLALFWKKHPVQAADSPGFIVNRVARLYYLESQKLVEEGIATMEQTDALLESCGFKMGPFKLMDFIGLDTNLSVSESLYHSFYQEPRFRPMRAQQKRVEAGWLGKKSGRGFYHYPSEGL